MGVADGNMCTFFLRSGDRQLVSPLGVVLQRLARGYLTSGQWPSGDEEAAIVLPAHETAAQRVPRPRDALAAL